MAVIPQFADVSNYQGKIDFAAYSKWSESFDGISRMAIKVTEGAVFIDPNFAANRAGALTAGIDEIYYYHFARPDLGNSAVREASFMNSVVGAIRENDGIALDYEVDSPLATAGWALAWLQAQEAGYGLNTVEIYASPAYIALHLQDPRLSRYKLWYAKWEFTPDERPPAPAPWTSYKYLQYTDIASNIPGITGTVDADIFLGGNTMTVPDGWTDNGITLTAPNGVPVVLGFRTFILNNNWDPNDYPLKPQYHANPLENSNPSIGEGDALDCRMSRLGYTPAKGVYKTWIGPELEWYQAQIVALQADPTAQENTMLKATMSQIHTLSGQ